MRLILSIQIIEPISGGSRVVRMTCDSETLTDDKGTALIAEVRKAGQQLATDCLPKCPSDLDKIAADVAATTTGAVT